MLVTSIGGNDNDTPGIMVDSIVDVTFLVVVGTTGCVSLGAVVESAGGIILVDSVVCSAVGKDLVAVVYTGDVKSDVRSGPGRNVKLLV